MDATLEGHLHRRCGGHYALTQEEVTIRLSGMSARVDREVYKCDKCGDLQHTVEQREAAEREAILTMRTQHTLLTPKEMKQFREGLGLTAQQLGDLLYGLPKGIVEGWEKGRYLQSPAVDSMVRSLSDRGELEARAARAGVVLPVPEGTSDMPGTSNQNTPPDVEPTSSENEASSTAEPAPTA
jgi:DNA-binding transcriptional regulator YiaG